MNAITIFVISIVALFMGYIFYGGWLAKTWGINPNKKTPAVKSNDNDDYVPTERGILFGHHFSSIAGASPISGPVQAAIFGWVPVVLWIVLGGIFFGAAQDFSSLFASIRNNGKSLVAITEKNVGKYGKQLFLIFALFTMLFLIASFIDIVASAFEGQAADGTKLVQSGASATASMLFIAASLVFGFFTHRLRSNFIVSSFLGVLLIVLCIALGLYFPLYFSKTTWIIVLLIYMFFAAITPVWVLLQPRDYLNAFLLYGMCFFAIVGIFYKHPQMQLAPFYGFNIAGEALFPVLFITVTCGAISGFHSLICSGTTAKQVKSEKDIKFIGFGGMILESIIALVVIIVVGAFFDQSNIYKAVPPVIFANALVNISAGFGIDTSVVYTVIMLSISALAFTTLDTSARLVRYLLQEYFQDFSNKFIQTKLTNPYIVTAIIVVFSGILALGGYKAIWPLFGTVNQLLAALALLTVSVWLERMGKKYKMLIFPMIFMLSVALVALMILLYNNIVSLVGGFGTFFKEGIQIISIIALIFLAINLILDSIRALWGFYRERKTIEDKYK